MSLRVCVVPILGQSYKLELKRMKNYLQDNVVPSVDRLLAATVVIGLGYWF